MSERGSADILRFDGFRFDSRRGGCLFRLDGAEGTEPVPLRGRALSLLSVLIERHGELVTKDEIMAAVWPGRAVEEANLNVQIGRLRGILGHGCIQTVHGHGYRFAASVRSESGPLIPAPADDGAPLHPHQLIVVLSIAAVSVDGSRQYFADRISGDLLIDLSRITDILGIPRDTAAALSNKPVEMPILRGEGADCAGQQPADALAPSGKNLGQSDGPGSADPADSTQLKYSDCGGRRGEQSTIRAQ